MAQNILIIGGAGFVGRNLINALAGNDVEITVLDRIPVLGIEAQFKQIIQDAQNVSILDQIIGDGNFDTVYHLAANSDISAGIEDAALDFQDTLQTSVALSLVLSKHPVRQVVFASSSAIFGVTQNPIAEFSSEYPEPISWYGKAKLASELVLKSLTYESKTKLLLVRFPNVVGPFATHGVVFDFINKLKANPSELQVLGDGFQEKPYIHVGDLIDAIKHLAKIQEKNIEIYNIGPTDTSTVRDIAEIICDVMQVRPIINYGDTPYGWIGDVPRYSFNTEQLSRSGYILPRSSKEAIRDAAKDLILQRGA